jgi:hypothetical protein
MTDSRFCLRGQSRPFESDLDLLQMLPGVVGEDADDTSGHGCRSDAEESD